MIDDIPDDYPVIEDEWPSPANLATEKSKFKAILNTGDMVTLANYLNRSDVNIEDIGFKTLNGEIPLLDMIVGHPCGQSVEDYMQSIIGIQYANDGFAVNAFRQRCSDGATYEASKPMFFVFYPDGQSKIKTVHDNKALLKAPKSHSAEGLNKTRLIVPGDCNGIFSCLPESGTLVFGKASFRTKTGEIGRLNIHIENEFHILTPNTGLKNMDMIIPKASLLRTSGNRPA